MAQRAELVLYEDNDEELQVTVVSEVGGGPYDLTGATLEMLIKPTADTLDSDPGVVVLSSAAIGEITVTSPAGGLATVVVDRSHLAEAGSRVWRLDVLRSGTRRTAMHGPLHVVNL